MTGSEFDIQMNRLIATYGKGAYPQERSLQVYRSVNGLSQRVFSAVVDELISECRQAPMIPEIREKVSRFREMDWNRTKQNPTEVYNPNAKVRCSQCRDTGSILASRKNFDPSPYAFRCNCDAGRADRRAFPFWETSLSASWEVL